MMKKIGLSTIISIFISAFAVGTLFSLNTNQQPTKETRATNEIVTVETNFISDFSSISEGSISGDIHYLSDESKNIDDVAFSLFNTETKLKDDNVSITYNGNNSSYAKGNLIRNKYNGYVQLHYPSIVNGDGAGFSIAPKDKRYKITNISMTTHSRNYSDSGESYQHIIKNGVDSYSSIADMGLSSSNPTYIWSDENGISDLEINVSLKQSPVGTKEKYLIISSFSITYEIRSDVYEVSFDTQGGTDIDSQYVISGESATRPSITPIKPSEGDISYLFDDWYTTADGDVKFDFSSAIVQNTTIYAHWDETAAEVFTMTFECNGGTPVSSIQATSGNAFVKPSDPTKETSDSSKYYYEFAEWYIDEKFKTKYDWTSLATEDLTLYAKWSFKTYDHTPSGRVHYNISDNAASWASTEHFTNDTYYQDVTLNSRETFDVAGAKEPVSLRIVSIDSSRGFYVHKVYSQLVRNANITITPVDETKIITFVRFDATNWGGDSMSFSLYKNDSITPSDTATTPDSDETTHYVQASFNSSERVKSVRINFPNKLICLKNFYIVYETDPVFEQAELFAKNFNDANVCGTLDTDGLNETKWNEQAEIFNDLNQDVKDYLKEYEGSNEEIVECLERYDRVISLHGSSYDFMGRIAAGKISGIKNITPVFDVTNNTLTVVITIVSLLAVSTILIYVYTKSYQKKR